MIAITGHTYGLGKALYDRFYPNAIGFSRSNGYDISNPEIRDKIVIESVDCDVFINNAYSDYSQTDLLYAFSEKWVGTNKLIINISSNSGDGIKNKPHEYAIHKSSLDKAAEQLSRIKNACRIINLRPGYIDTDRVRDVTEPKLDVEYMVSVISWLLQQPKNSTVVSMTVLPR